MNLAISRPKVTAPNTPYPQSDLEAQPPKADVDIGMNRGYHDFSGIGVNLHSFLDALNWMSSVLQMGPDNTTATVAFLNTHNLNVAWSDPEYRRALQQFERVFPDGIGLRIAGMMTGIPCFENLAGTDLVPSLLRQPTLHGKRVFILGETPAQIEDVKDSFCRLFPHLTLAGYHHGFFELADSGAVVEFINTSQADILLVGMGTPRQEKWLSQHGPALKPKLRIGVGGLFHYWDGRLRRAPAILRRMKLEWAFILLQQPHRWRRYVLGAPRLLWRAGRDALHGPVSHP